MAPDLAHRLRALAARIEMGAPSLLIEAYLVEMLVEVRALTEREAAPPLSEMPLLVRSKH